MLYKIVHTECTVHTYYTYAYIIPVASSVTEAVATLVTPNENRTEHSITVTCTVRPESNADMCVVMAMADGRMTRSGKYVHMYISTSHAFYMSMYVCVHKCGHT